MSKYEVKITPKNALNSVGFEAELEGDIGGGSEPAAYIKEVEVQGNKLIITNKDGSKVNYIPETDLTSLHSDFDESLFELDTEVHDLTEEQAAELAKITANTVFVGEFTIARKAYDEDCKLTTLAYGYNIHGDSGYYVQIDIQAKSEGTGYEYFGYVLEV